MIFPVRSGGDTGITKNSPLDSCSEDTWYLRSVYAMPGRDGGKTGEELYLKSSHVMPAVLLILTVFGLVYGCRISVEEKTLRRELGEEYFAYMKRTKRLIPHII